MEQSPAKGFVRVLHEAQLRKGFGSLGKEFVFDTETSAVLVSLSISLAAVMMMSFSCALYYFQSSFTFINVLTWYSSSL